MLLNSIKNRFCTKSCSNTDYQIRKNGCLNN